MTETLQKRSTRRSHGDDVTPVFITDETAESGNAIPPLARLLIDLAQRELTTENRPTMLKEVPTVQEERSPQWSLAV